MTRNEAAAHIKGFIQHGFKLKSVSGKYARGKCMFCDADEKKRDAMSIHVDKLFWTCMRCGEKGNFADFLTLMSAKYRKAFRGDVAARLAKDCRLSVATLRGIGIGWYGAQKLITIPFYQGDKVTQLQLKPPGKDAFSTSGGKRGYIVQGSADLAASAWIVEGHSDVGALREGLIGADYPDLVVGICGAIAGLGPKLANIVQGLSVALAFDNDATGIKADKRARELLAGKVSSLHSVHWPKDAKQGYDIRDLWLETKKKPHVFTQKLTKMLSEDPREEDSGEKPRKTVGAVVAAESRRKQDALTGKGITREETIARYREWLYLPNTDVIDVLFGTVFANRFRGNPLWLILVGMPGCGKTELIMSLYQAPLIFSITTLTPQALVSGKDGPGGQDPSIIPMLDQKVLVVEDFDPILSMNKDDQSTVFSVLRTSYNGRFEKRFGNGIYRNYPYVYGMIVGATPKIEVLGATHAIVGERFVKFYMTGASSLNAGSEVVLSIIESMNDASIEKERRAALASVGRDTLNRPVTEAQRPKIGKSVIPKLHALAMWTANMRGAVARDKYTGQLVHKPVTEIATRLAEQLSKLAMGIAVFRGKRVVTIDEFRVVARIAVSSVPDLVEEIAKQMYVRKDRGYVEPKELVEWTGYNSQTVRSALDDMATLSILEKQKDKGRGYRLSPIIVNMMQPMGLYAKERQWGRVKEEGHPKTKKTVSKRRVRR